MNWNPFDWTGPDFLMFYGILIVVYLFVRLGRSHRLKSLRFSPAEGPLPDLSPYHMALLARGRPGVVQAVLAAFYSRGWLVKKENSLEVVPDHPPATDPFEERALAAAGTAPFTVSDFSARSNPAMEMLEADLEERGLFLPGKKTRGLLPGVVALGGVILAIGVAKAVLGWMRDRPVGFVVLLSIVVFALMFTAWLKKTRRTPLGQSVLTALREANAEPSPLSPSSLSPELGATALAVPILVGLYGASVMSALGYAEFPRVVPLATTGDAGGGAGCGGGSCGSSCGGGCGGCGGGGD